MLRTEIVGNFLTHSRGIDDDDDDDDRDNDD